MRVAGEAFADRGYSDDGTLAPRGRPGGMIEDEDKARAEKVTRPVPAEYRGIGVRIEDDILVTPTGARNLSADLPRRAEEIEAWMAGLWTDGPANLGLG